MTVEAFRKMRVGWAALSLLASITHVAVRFTILPVIVHSMSNEIVPLAPLVVWPLGIIYGAGVVPAPGGVAEADVRIVWAARSPVSSKSH